MNFFAKLTMLALVGAIAVTGSSYASSKMSTTKSTAKTTTKSVKPTCLGATVYAVAANKTYYTRGEKMYGHAKRGSYMCMAAANRLGYKKL